MLSFFPQTSKSKDDALIYSCNQHGIIFNFYANKYGKLCANTIVNGYAETALSIKGVPIQNGLQGQAAKDLVKKMLGNYYFKRVGYDIDANFRILGGWKDQGHSDITKRAIEMVCPSAGLSVITHSNLRTDYGSTSPLIPTFFAQKFHFNCNDPECHNGGSETDSRIQVAVAQLKKAIKIYEYNSHKKTCASLAEIGTGLHALQDIFAHIDAFVGNMRGIACNHIGNDCADDPFCQKKSSISVHLDFIDTGYQSKLVNQR